jgi:CheY-like chemotaxis protein
MDRKKKVLLLDHDADLLIALERLLEDCGFDCTSTWDLDQGCALMETGVYDFLVIGNRPPYLNPHDVLSDLRREGLRFGSFILGNLDHQDGFSNLLDQLRSYPCEQSLREKKPSGKQGLEEPDFVCHGS